MARPTFKVRLVVLRKTKLGEKDVIVTYLAEDGSLGKAVAKGARKPGGSYAARLELFSVADCLIVEGRSLGVVGDAKLAGGPSFAHADVEQTACASAIAELVCSVAQEGLAHLRLFDMTRAALALVAESEPDRALAVTLADLLKTLAISGFRPMLDECAVCGSPVDLSAGTREDARAGRVAEARRGQALASQEDSMQGKGAQREARPPEALRGKATASLVDAAQSGGTQSQRQAPLPQPAFRIPVSAEDGGVLCLEHAHLADAHYAPETVAWVRALTLATFAEVLDAAPDTGTLLSILPFLRQWCATHIGRSPKSLDFLRGCYG